MEKKWKKRIRTAGAVILAGIVICCCQTSAFAYFDRGDISVSTGQKKVTLTQGESTNVSVTLSPSSSKQLPGCGMPECPQVCGEKECLNEDGECTCAGTDYQTYYATAQVSSSNTSVATASYSSGSVQIKAIEAGTATITVTGMLRQFTSSSSVITVEVQAKNDGSAGQNSGDTGTNSNSGDSQSSSAGNTDSQKGSSSKNTGSKTDKKKGGGSDKKVSSDKKTNSDGEKTSDKKVTAVSPSGDGGNVSVAGQEEISSQKTDSSATDPALQENGQDVLPESSGNADGQSGNGVQNVPSGITSIESEKGTVYFQDITAGTMGKTLFDVIIGKKAYATFQKKDESGNVVYSMEFCGEDLKESKDFDMGLTISEEAGEDLKNAAGNAGVLYLVFAEAGAFPGKAEFYMQVGDRYSDGETFCLYHYNEETKQAELVAEDVSVVNGYISRELEQGGSYFLTKEALAENRKSAAPAVVVIVIAAAVACAVVIRKKRLPGGNA